MTSLLKKTVKIQEYYTTQQIQMFTNMQHHMLRHILLLCHWLQNCKLGHGRRLRCAFALPNPSAVVTNSCTQRRRDATTQFRLVGVGGVYWALDLNFGHPMLKTHWATLNISLLCMIASC